MLDRVVREYPHQYKDYEVCCMLRVVTNVYQHGLGIFVFLERIFL